MFQYKSNHTIFLLFCFCLPINTFIYAQRFSGINPSIKWEQISTKKAKIIYPVELSSDAQRLANVIDFLYDYDREAIGPLTRNIKFVLLGNTAISNGSVGSAPFKSEFFMSPPRDHYQLGTLNWTDLLALHEYRHVLQRSNSLKGATKVGYLLFGELTWSGMSNLAIPNWFREGDAVVAETSQSNQGRGRNPAFLDAHRDYFLNESYPNYNQARNGSIIKFVPDHYRFGYLMTTYGRSKYGDDFWEDILADGGAYKGVLFPFKKALKSKTGIGMKAFYKEAMEFHKIRMTSKNKKPSISFNYLSAKNKGFHNYSNPQLSTNNRLYAVKTSFDKRSSIIEILENGEEKLLVNTPIINEQYFSEQAGLFTWSEARTDARWTEDNYSVIVVYNSKKKTKSKISSRSKYFQPSLSNNGAKIICTEILATSCQLKILQTKDGSLLKTLPNVNNFIYTYPKWDNQENIIVCARKNNGEIALVKLDADGELIDTLLPFRADLIGIPQVSENYVTTTAAYGGNIHIYQIDKQGSISKISDHTQSVYQPIFDEEENKIYFSEFQIEGNRLGYFSPDKNRILYNLDKKQVFKNNILDKIPNKSYPTKKYSKFAHFINPHSWGINLESFRPEIKISSTNYLNTIDISGGAYLEDGSDVIYNANINFATFLPIVNLGWRSENQSAIVQDSVLVKFWDTDYGLTVSAPFNFSDGNYFRNFLPFFGIQHNQLNITNFEVENINITSLRTGLTFRNQNYRPQLRLFSKFGQYIRVDYSSDIDERDARQFQIKTALALPGIAKTHSLILEADYKSQKGDRLSDSFKYSRGYRSRLEYDSFYRLSADYHFPLFYPDWGIEGLFFIKRINIDLFADYSHMNLLPDVEQVDFRSIGSEISTDIRFLNTQDLRIAFRFAYRLNDISGRPLRFTFLLPVYRF